MYDARRMGWRALAALEDLLDGKVSWTKTQCKEAKSLLVEADERVGYN